LKMFLENLSLLFYFWPVIIIIGIQGFSRHEGNFQERLTKAIHNSFWGWSLFGVIALILVATGYPLNGLLPQPYNLVIFLALGYISGVVTIASLVVDFKRRREEADRQGSLEHLRSLSPYEFEALVSRFFQFLGYRTRPYEDRQDHGVDVIVYNGKGEKWIVQCKRYRGVVGEPILRDLLGAMLHEKASRAFLMTTGTISHKARSWIEDKPITVYEGEALVRLFKTINTPKQ
jgi:HJR/Mrr/RecB family endonuclease